MAVVVHGSVLQPGPHLTDVPAQLGGRLGLLQSLEQPGGRLANGRVNQPRGGLGDGGAEALGAQALQLGPDHLGHPAAESVFAGHAVTQRGAELDVEVHVRLRERDAHLFGPLGVAGGQVAAGG